jgi:hypothetical protein
MSDEVLRPARALRPRCLFATCRAGPTSSPCAPSKARDDVHRKAPQSALPSFLAGLVSCSRPATGSDGATPQDSPQSCFGPFPGIEVKTKKPPASRPEAFLESPSFKAGQKCFGAARRRIRTTNSPALGKALFSLRFHVALMPHELGDPLKMPLRLTGGTSAEADTRQDDRRPVIRVQIPKEPQPLTIR